MKTLAFTVQYDNLARELMTSCGISMAFHPKKFANPQIKQYHALWDTGANGCVISRRVADHLDLKPIGIRQVYTASSGKAISVNEYLINIFLPNNAVATFIRATEGTLNDFDVLVGMDIISIGDFAITNTGGRTLFSFQMPSTHRIDFAQK